MEVDITFNELGELLKVLIEANPRNLLIICVTVVILLLIVYKSKANVLKDEKKDQ